METKSILEEIDERIQKSEKKIISFIREKFDELQRTAQIETKLGKDGSYDIIYDEFKHKDQRLIKLDIHEAGIYHYPNDNEKDFYLDSLKLIGIVSNDGVKRDQEFTLIENGKKIIEQMTNQYLTVKIDLESKTLKRFDNRRNEEYHGIRTLRLEYIFKYKEPKPSHEKIIEEINQINMEN
jgi:hypothetical protein